MKNINKIKPKEGFIFEDKNERITLILNETVVEMTTDGTGYDKKYKGLITFISEDGIEIEASYLIRWESVLEIKIL